jgi:hypothetical protein
MWEARTVWCCACLWPFLRLLSFFAAEGLVGAQTAGTGGNGDPYWAGNIFPGVIGRSNLDGSGLNNPFITPPSGEEAFKGRGFGSRGLEAEDEQAGFNH